MTEFDAIIVGSGPNGLSAAIRLAQEGLSVALYEAKESLGGGMRSAELTLPGFMHDICSAIHPLGVASPFFKTLPLEKYGLEWIQPQIPLAHPFDDGTAALLNRSIEATSATVGDDAEGYRDLMEPIVANWDKIASDLLGPLNFPQHPLEMLQFGILAFRSASGLAESYFQGERARSLFAGLAAHSNQKLDTPVTAAFGLILGALGHVAGWPLAKGGSQKIADALAAFFSSLGGKIFTGIPVESLEQLPSAKVFLFDVTPKQLLKIAGNQLPARYRDRLVRYRYGPGVFKIDWALSAPIPWKAPECLQAGTVHLGGTLQEIVLSEQEVWQGKYSEKPFVLLAQQSVFDSTRAPPGKHTGWAYCHVPNGSTVDMTEQIEAQVERFAPGFRDCILARCTRSAKNFELYNANYIGGDINGGVQDLFQLFTRPIARWVPYSTPIPGLYFCSSSTPPGGGVHGMCGYHAANAALKYLLN